MVVKNLAEMSSYQRRYEFFHSMGMKQKEQKKILSFEICSVANIALGTGICLALLYVMTYLHWYDAIGEKISTTFWSYWLKLVGIYIIIQIVVQKLFAKITCLLQRFVIKFLSVIRLQKLAMPATGRRT